MTGDMDEAGKTEQESDRRDPIVARREAERRQERRNRLVIAGSAIAVVVIVVIALVLVKANSKSPAPGNAAAPKASPAGAALNSVMSTLTSVPTSATDAAGNGGSQMTGKPQTIPGTLLTANGKPEMLYVGAEYCPYCAAERWSMIVALSRFGTFSGLKPIRSAVKDGAGHQEPYGNTATWTFYRSGYTSNYLTFIPVEVQTNIPDASTGTYTTLQQPTSEQNAIFNKWDAPPYVPAGYNGSFPFVDFGNKYLIVGASYSPGVLANLSWSQIAASLSKPTSAVAMGVDGAANYIAAAICKLTSNQPASACTSTVQGLESQI
jgi:hypothetical protein